MRSGGQPGRPPAPAPLLPWHVILAPEAAHEPLRSPPHEMPALKEWNVINRNSSTHADTVLLTFKEAMEFLRVSRSTIYRLMWSGQLRGHKVGSTWRFYENDLLAAVETATFEPAQTRATRN
jgi:excisionase family DNA binding protein